MVTQLLPLQQPFRELFAAHVASSFPETTRQRLAGWLLERYPDAAKAYRDLGPAIGEPQPVLRSHRKGAELSASEEHPRDAWRETHQTHGLPVERSRNSQRFVCLASLRDYFLEGIVFHPDYSPPWPEKHRFPMWKFHALAQQLYDDQLVEEAELLKPWEVPRDMVLLAHDEAYYEGFCQHALPSALWRRIGFTQRPCHHALVRRTRLEVMGTLIAARQALEYGMAGNCAGGTHHAHRAYGSGYTALNDLAITAKVLLKEELVDRVLICDLDVHQGDGTAEILKERQVDVKGLPL
eukprot:symbB.v1.2.019745.t1/scaffold1627.1/size108904/4